MTKTTATLLICAAALTACGRADDPAGQLVLEPAAPATTRHALPRGMTTMPNPDRRSPAAVADAALILMHSQDSAIDTTPQDAVERAMPLMDPAYAQLLRANPVRARSDWETLARQRGYTTAKVFKTEEERLREQAGPAPSPTGTTKVIRALTIESHDDSGWRSIETATVTLELHQTPDGTWAVTGYRR